MKQDGSFGKFFPAKMNPFYFNRTFATYMTKYSKEDIEELGFMYETEQETTQISGAINSRELQQYYDTSGKITENILDVTLQDDE